MQLKKIKLIFQFTLILLILNNVLCIDSFKNNEKNHGRAIEPLVTKLTPVYNNEIDKKIDLDLEHVPPPNDFVNLMRKIKNISYGLRVLIDRFKNYLPQLGDNQSILNMPTPLKFLIGKRYLLDGLKMLLKSLEQYITGRYLENFTEKQTGRLFGAVFPRVFNTYNFYVPELNLGRCAQVYVRQYLPPLAEFRRRFDEYKKQLKESYDSVIEYCKSLYLNLFYKVKQFYIKYFVLPKLIEKQNELKKLKTKSVSTKTVKTLPEHIMRIKRDQENEKMDNSLDEFTGAILRKSNELDGEKNKELLKENETIQSKENYETDYKKQLKQEYWPGLDINEIDFYNVLPESIQVPGEENESEIVSEVLEKDVEIDIVTVVPEKDITINIEINKEIEKDNSKEKEIEKADDEKPVEEEEQTTEAQTTEAQPQPQEAERFGFTRCVSLYGVELLARVIATRFIGAPDG